ncbi:MAG: hypothetical protein DRQ47_06065 [Gammaproteobacteria bacterium]|nr:MAG: hypothetical protein DRQ47_06065 [Gammaproteobacteria bacterium]
MKKVLLILCVLGMFLFVSNSFAVDFGFYLDLGSGSGEAEYDIAYSERFDMDSDFFGLGFQLETNPITPKKIFSYRLQAGFESRGMEDDYGTTLELGGLVFNNTFAFGGNTSAKTRLWGGPQILVGFYSGKTDDQFQGDEISYTGTAFALGLAGGANFGLGSGKTILTTTIGVRSLAYSGDAEWYDWNETLEGNSTDIFISVGMLF